MQNLTSGKLISGKTVQGTDVYSPTGDKLGHVDDVLIDATSGRVVYGILEFGGFLGMGADHHSIPFGRLRYEPTHGGYVTDLTKEQLEGAPPRPDDWMTNRDWEERAHRHYGVSPYWM